MEIKILGTGCAKCKTTQAVVEKVVAESGVKATITKIEDIVEIMKYNVMFTPAVVVDEVVKIKGRVPSEKEVKQILGL
ncbi:MAG: thioredoxin family protein [Bacteroidales bacterium]